MDNSSPSDEVMEVTHQQNAMFILELPRNIKRALVFSGDIFLCMSTVWIAYYLRLGIWIEFEGARWLSLVGAIAILIPIFIRFRLYSSIFRYAGWNNSIDVVRAVLVYGLIYSSIFSSPIIPTLWNIYGDHKGPFTAGLPSIPRTIGFIQPLLLLIAILASRGLARYWLGGNLEVFLSRRKNPSVMIYGAGSAGRQLAAALVGSREMEVKGFIDDDQTLQGSRLNGIMVYPSSGFVPLITKFRVSNILLAIPSASRARRNQIIEMARNANVNIRTLPGVMDLAHGRVTVNDLHELEIEDLLGRDAVPPHKTLMSKNITGKTVLVTGAGGSIGSELCRQILPLSPSLILLIDISEFALYTIHQELIKRLSDKPDLIVEVIPLLASVTDKARLHLIMSSWKPDTVYHAAAYKHVPLVEQNIVEGIRNNLFGTQIIAHAAEEAGVKDFVLISTDKAVRPTNIMGASKRISEMFLQAYADNSSSTCFSMVRFGNVLGSSGSVVPLFRKQIYEGRVVTITDKEMTRYFMTIPEAAQLVIQAGAMATGGEVFVLDMGEPVKIFDLACNMIRLSGLQVRDESHPDGDIEIEVIGLRPGEKLYEELLIGDNPVATSHSRVMKANEKFLPWDNLMEHIAALTEAMDKNDIYQIREILKTIVPEFTPDLTIVDWLFEK